MAARVKVGIREVARAAGVSTATVSQVYNRKGEVASDTRRRVLEVGARLGYRPNLIGQALRSGRSRVIGVVISHQDYAVWEQTYMPVYQSIIAGAAIEAVSHGYSISAAPSSPSGDIETQVPLDGIIVIDPVIDDPVVERSLEAGLAVIADGGFDPSDPTARLRSVRYDMAQGVPALLDHLARSAPGKQLQPALVIGPRIDTFSVDTEAAYRSWCVAHGVPAQIAALALDQEPVDAARALVAQMPHVNAVHCLNETYSNAVIAAATERGIEIPTDLQISAFGSSRSTSADSRVAYLCVDPLLSGARCARMLIALLEGSDVDDVVEVAALVPAGGTAVPPALGVSTTSRES